MFQSRSRLSRLHTIGAAVIAMIGAGALAACSEADVVSPEAASTVSQATPAFANSEVAGNGRDIAALRRATARYHRVSAAKADGYTVTPLPCVDPSPFGTGGLGIPHMNPERLTDGDLSITEPAILFYEPQKNGRLRLVGVEVVIPIAQWEGDSPPVLFGQELHRNEAAGLFGIHIWVWKHNPAGMFNGGNPRVSCEFAK